MIKYMTFLLLLVSPFCWAVDTTEAFARGLSDIELHSEMGKFESSITGVVGYGYSAWINPSLALTRIREISAESTLTEFEVGNFANLYQGFFDIDLLVGTKLREDEESSHFAGTEISAVRSRFMPFVKNVFEFAANETSTASSLGVSFQSSKEIQLFTESTWDLKNGQHTALAFGLNYEWTMGGMEVISELGQKTEEAEAYASLGAIWTLE